MNISIKPYPYCRPYMRTSPPTDNTFSTTETKNPPPQEPLFMHVQQGTWEQKDLHHVNEPDTRPSCRGEQRNNTVRRTIVGGAWGALTRNGSARRSQNNFMAADN